METKITYDGGGTLTYEKTTYKLSAYGCGDDWRCVACGGYGHLADAVVLLWKAPEIPNPRGFDFIFLWDCGNATWEREIHGRDIYSKLKRRLD